MHWSGKALIGSGGLEIETGKEDLPYSRYRYFSLQLQKLKIRPYLKAKDFNFGFKTLELDI